MPGKYSHSLVLVDYSSRGIINLPHDQYTEYVSAVPSRSASRKSNHPTFRPESAQSFPYRSPSANSYAKDYSAPNRSVGSVVTNSASLKPRLFLDMEDESEMVGGKLPRSTGSQHPRKSLSPGTNLSKISKWESTDASLSQQASLKYQESHSRTTVNPVDPMPVIGIRSSSRPKTNQISKTVSSPERLVKLPDRITQENSKNVPGGEVEPILLDSRRTPRSKPLHRTASGSSASRALPQTNDDSISEYAQSFTSTRGERVRKAKLAGILKHQERARVIAVAQGNRSDSIQTTETQIYDPPNSLNEPNFDGFSDIAPAAETYFERPLTDDMRYQQSGAERSTSKHYQPTLTLPTKVDISQIADDDNIPNATFPHSLFEPPIPRDSQARQSNEEKLGFEARQSDSQPAFKPRGHQRNESDSSLERIRRNRFKAPGTSTPTESRSTFNSPTKSIAVVPERHIPSRATAASIADSFQTGSITSLSSASSLGGTASGRRPKTNDTSKDSAMQTHHETRWGLPEIKEDSDFSSAIFDDEYVRALDISSSLNKDVSVFGHISSGRDVNFDNDDGASDLSAACPPNISRWRDDETEFAANMSRIMGENHTASSKNLGRSETPVSKKRGLFSRFKLRR